MTSLTGRILGQAFARGQVLLVKLLVVEAPEPNRCRQIPWACTGTLAVHGLTVLCRLVILVWVSVSSMGGWFIVASLVLPLLLRAAVAGALLGAVVGAVFALLSLITSPHGSLWLGFTQMVAFTMVALPAGALAGLITCAGALIGFAHQLSNVLCRKLAPCSCGDPRCRHHDDHLCRTCTNSCGELAGSLVRHGD